jgi:hypothetical protein
MFPSPTRLGMKGEWMEVAEDPAHQEPEFSGRY